MRINELVNESQTLDELSLGGVAQGIGKLATGAAKAYGYAKGIPAALSRASQQGQAAAMANLGHGAYKAKPAPNRTAYNQELSKRLGGTQPAVTAPAAAPQDSASLRKQAQELKTQASELEKQAIEADREAKQAQAAQSAQDQMAPVSKLPPDSIRPAPTTEGVGFSRFLGIAL